VRSVTLSLPFETSTIILDVRLFGPFQVSHHNQSPIEFRSNAERALLAYLVVEADHPHSREFLCSLIWPDLSEEKAHNNLRVTLSRLRKSIKTADPDFDAITVSRLSVQANTNKVLVDVSAFMELIHQTESHMHPPHDDCIECTTRLERAIQIFRGEFLQGFTLTNNIPYQEWLVLQREKFNRCAINSFHSLGDYHLRRGKLGKVQTLARRQLELEPWREEAHRQLMICFAMHDEKNAALAQYEQCKRVLKEELGVAPSFETLELYEHIKRSRGRKHPVLPTASTNFVGREKEQREIIQTLSKPDCRVLSLIGIGGVGKTRLAVQVANQLEYAFLDGVIFVSLVAIQNPERIPNAIADALEFSFTGASDSFQQLLNYLENKEYLIILDNFEHMLEAIPMLVRIWEQCPGIKMLITSRERLGLEQEYLIEIGGLLALQTTDNLGRPSPAVDLFLGCIHKQDSFYDPAEQDLEKLVELCSLVKGMPLALELIAPITRVLSIQEIINDIHALDLSSLDAVFERSWKLLTSVERRGFMQLSIFNTPFTRQAAREVADIDLTTFTSLVDKSLIQRNNSVAEIEGDQDSVYFDFHPLLKQFAYQKLKGEPEVLESVLENHANYFLNLLDQVYESILTPDETPAIKIIHARHEDIVTAVKWSCYHGYYESIRKGLQIHIHYFESYGAFHLGKIFFGEIVQILKEVKSQQKEITDELNQGLARATWYYGWHLMRLGDYQEALDYENEADQLAKASQDGIVETGALNAIGVIQRFLGDLDRSNQYFRSALEAARQENQEVENKWHVASINNNLGMNALAQSRLDLAGEYIDTAMKHYTEIGHYWGIAGAYLSFGNLYIKLDEYEKARSSFEDGLELAETHNYQWMKIKLLVGLGDLAFKQGDWETAVRYYQESFYSIEEFGDKVLLEETQGKFQEANRLARR